MQITVQQTPNPNARKFVLAGHRFARPISFAGVDAAAADPLAKQLFALGGIYNVFMVQDFVTVNKLPHAEWDDLESRVRQILAEHFG